LFVAIELPAEALRLLGAIQEQVRANLGAGTGVLKWSRPEGIHMTLQFLGEVPGGRIGAIEQALRQAAASARAFNLGVGGLGAFPNVRRPRVLWVGLTGDTDAALSLAAAVSANLAPLGFKPDKPFSPHMTIARVREGTSPAQLAPISRILSLTDDTLPAPSTFRVEGISLMQSRLQPGGSAYTRVAYEGLGTRG
jgi:RNA 2',3'-cyclic 3'-phosphodiesterase